MLTVWFWKRAYFGFYESRELIKITLSLLLGAITIWGITGFWKDFVFYNKLTSFLIGISLATIAFLVFIGANLLFKVDEIQLIRTKVLNRMKAGNGKETPI
jgi:putative peptidoglycan lipid II flippase